VTPSDAEVWIDFFTKHWYFFLMGALAIITVRRLWRDG
jgi:hypothetical protein